MTFLSNPRSRGYLIQAVLLLLLVATAIAFAINARNNLQAKGIATGFGFFQNTAGFGVNQTLIPYREADSYGRVFLVGLFNTLLVSAIGIVFATIIGFLVGVGRLSSNWLVARLCGAYVEVLRNLPLLFQILFWYLAVLAALPPPRQALNLADTIFLTNRGIALPSPVMSAGLIAVLGAFAIGAAVTLLVRAGARQRQEATGQQFPVGRAALLLLIVMPFGVAAALGFPFVFDVPQLRGFNFTGGVTLIPEFAALLIALSTYTAAFIAEIVRAGVLAVSRGQTEAAYSLGLRPRRTLRLVVIPQALRVIIPPLTSQYLNLTKNSSLAVAVGYPDLFAVFAGTTLNQTGQAIEILGVTMAVYLTISLVTSAAMNRYNNRLNWGER